jgi:hypothetical protein
VIAFIRAARVAIILVLATLAVSFVVALARPETGPVEKLALVALFACCVVAAARVSTWSTRAVARIRQH